MRIGLVICLFIFQMTCFAGASKWPVNLEGTYHCDSTETDIHKHYKGQMSLKRTGETYSVKMSFDDGSAYTGTGIYDQEQHVFSLVFVNPHKAEEIGVALSQIRQDGAHLSDWTYLNKKSLSKAICTIDKV